MRELTSHKVSGLNEQIEIRVLDEPGQGGSCHCYQILAAGAVVNIDFQNGPVHEAGVNGISNEALLAVVEDRLKCFQSGPFACRENALALTHLQECMHWLHHRTNDRVNRGVEGTQQK